MNETCYQIGYGVVRKAYVKGRVNPKSIPLKPCYGKVVIKVRIIVYLDF